MNKYDYPMWELRQDASNGDQICEDYEKKEGESWICFDCHYKKECIYKRDKDLQIIFNMSSYQISL